MDVQSETHCFLDPTGQLPANAHLLKEYITSLCFLKHSTKASCHQLKTLSLFVNDKIENICSELATTFSPVRLSKLTILLFTSNPSTWPLGFQCLSAPDCHPHCCYSSLPHNQPVCFLQICHSPPPLLKIPLLLTHPCLPNIIRFLFYPSPSNSWVMRTTPIVLTFRLQFLLTSCDMVSASHISLKLPSLRPLTSSSLPNPRVSTVCTLLCCLWHCRLLFSAHISPWSRLMGLYPSTGAFPSSPTARSTSSY